MRTPVKVELWYDGDWHDHISDVFDENADREITITRGRGSETERMRPTRAELSLNNAGGKYVLRNPMSPLYGKIRRGTPIRISTTDPESVRFVGQVESWPKQWSVDEAKAWAPITAYGVTHRLGLAGQRKLARSALHRYVMQRSPLAFWPMTEGSVATSGPWYDAVDPEDSGRVIISLLDETVRPGVGELAPWLPRVISITSREAGPSFGGVPISGIGPFDMDFMTRAGPQRDDTAGARIGVVGNSWRYLIDAAWSAGTPTLALIRQPVGSSSTTTMDTAASGDAAKFFDDLPHVWRIRVEQDGSAVDVTVYCDGEEIMSGTHSSTTFGGDVTWGAGFARMDAVLGMVVLWHSQSASHNDVPAAAGGWAGEEAHDRISRICAEEGIAATIVGSSSAQLGPQGIGTPLEIAEEAAAADDGILVETRSQVGLTYICHSAILNRAPTATLDYSAGGEVAPDMLPIEDVNHIRNDVTVTRIGGKSVTLPLVIFGELERLQLTEDVYPYELRLSLASDDQVLQKCAWHLHVGTWDDERYAAIPLDPTALDADGKTGLISDVVDLDVGHRIVVTHPPVWAGPNQVDQLVQGYTEVLGSYHWRIVLNTTPMGPWLIGMVGTGRAGGTAIVAEPVNATQTTITIDHSGFSGFSATAVPYDVALNGERMTVTAVSDLGDDIQALTVVRSVNGVVRSHSIGGVVQIHQPLRYGP